jgi:hypothetical protein
MSKILEWVDKGKLPTFKQLLSQGSYGEFENIFRGMSVDAWAAYNTGVGPGQNNFFGSHPWTLHDRTAYQTSGINRLFRMHSQQSLYVGGSGCKSRFMRNCNVLASER